MIGGLKKSNDVPVLTLLYKFSPEENKNQSSAAGNNMPKRWSNHFGTLYLYQSIEPESTLRYVVHI